MKIAERMQDLGSEMAFEVLAKAKALEEQGRDIVHLEIGEPDFDTPSHIIEAGIKAIREGYTHYGPTAGLPDLKAAIGRNIRETRGIDIDPGRVLVTPGGKPIIFFTALALLQNGDEVMYPDPGFPIYESMIRFLGARPVPIRLREEEGCHLDLEDLEAKISKRTKMVIINSPHNPTGSVMSRQEVANLADILKKREDIYILSDEIYKDILYEGEHFSIASIPGMERRTIILDGFSKSYAMTGWRLGYGIFPEEVFPHVDKLAANSVSCAAAFTQKAAIAALDGPQSIVAERVCELKRRRDVIVEGLRGIPGIECPKPQGAFYVFPNIVETGITSWEFQERGLKEAGVALLAGESFGGYGKGFVRLSYATSVKNIQKAIDRLGHWVMKCNKN